MTSISKLAFAAAILVALAGSAYADRVGPGWISIEQATQKAKDAGYTEISKMNVDDGHWEGEGMKGGKYIEFHMDPKTGAISNEHPDD